jgi:membrane protein YdbS with pleckstrin-like domain
MNSTMRLNIAGKKPAMRRRLGATTLVLISQMLLIALALAWSLQTAIIAIEGSAYFIENNHLILYGEIAVVSLIIIFAVFVLIVQIRRLDERRRTDRNEDRRS